MQRMFEFIVAALIAGYPLCAGANTVLYNVLKSETRTGAAPEPDVCIRPTGKAFPCGPTEDERFKIIREALLKKAMHYRSVFFSGNSCNQSPQNYRNLGTAMEIFLGQQPSNVLDRNNSEINAAIDRVTAEVAAMRGMSEAQKLAEFRNRMASETNEIVSSRVYDDAGDQRMMGNCTHISQVMYVDLLAEWRNVPGLKVSIYYFAGKDPATNLRAHYFNVVECDGDSFIVDGWRGDGEVYGPLSFDAESNTFSPKNAGVTLDTYYSKPLGLWLSKTVK